MPQAISRSITKQGTEPNLSTDAAACLRPRLTDFRIVHCAHKASFACDREPKWEANVCSNQAASGDAQPSPSQIDGLQAVAGSGRPQSWADY